MIKEDRKERTERRCGEKIKTTTGNRMADEDACGFEQKENITIHTQSV
jgi:hypothetical protein